MDKTTAGQKGSGGLQDVELKRRVGGIYGGGGGGGGREKEREGKEDDDRLKHFWSIGLILDLSGQIAFLFLRPWPRSTRHRFTYQPCPILATVNPVLPNTETNFFKEPFLVSHAQH